MAVDRADVVEPERLEERRGIGALHRGEPRHGRRVAAAVVVEHDHRVAPAVAEVVQRLVGQAAGEGAVADHRDHLAGVSGGVTGDREAVRVAHRGGRVAVLDEVVLGLQP